MGTATAHEDRLIIDIIYEGLDAGLTYEEIAKKLNEEMAISPEWGAWNGESAHLFTASPTPALKKAPKPPFISFDTLMADCWKGLGGGRFL